MNLLVLLIELLLGACGRRMQLQPVAITTGPQAFRSARRQRRVSAFQLEGAWLPVVSWLTKNPRMRRPLTPSKADLHLSCVTTTSSPAERYRCARTRLR